MNRTKKIKVEQPKSLPVSLNEFFGKDSLNETVRLFEKINTPIIRRKETGISLRVLNSWIKENLIDDTVNEVRRFSFTEFVWIRVISELRAFECSRAFIRTLKSNLFEPIKLKGLTGKLEKAKDYIDELKLPKDQKEQLLKLMRSTVKEEDSFNILQVVIAESIIKRISLSFAVFSDGSYLIVDKTKEHIYSEAEREKLNTGSYINLSITNILKEFFLSDLSGFVIPQINLLSPAENKIFEVIQSGDYESITINFKDRKPKLLELKKSADIKQKIIDILSKGGEYGEVIIKKHKGAIVKIDNTEKVIL